MNKLTNEEALKRAKEKHGDTFDYSEFEYVDSNKKVKIICKKHGVFLQLYGNHLKYNGCPSCRMERKRTLYQKTTDKFIEEAKSVHGARYDYSKVDYVNCETKILIGCKYHGFFQQIPSDHLSGKGCAACSGRAIVSDEEYLRRMRYVHGDEYDLSKFHYINAKTKVTIVCKKHGDFQILPYSFLAGHGCAKCNGNQSKGEALIRHWLRLHGIQFKEQHSFTDCRNVLPLPFDFYIPDDRILIEYDGEGHFVPIVRGDMLITEAEFILAEQKKRDLLKTEWAIANGYTLVRIRYDEHVGDKLKELYGNRYQVEFNCRRIKMVDIDLIEANSYNPNSVPQVNMELLKTSIDQNGFCYPVVVIADNVLKKYIIIDGYHRYKILRDIYKSETCPVIVLKHHINERMTATVQFNRARGVHKIDGDATIVVTLSKNGMSDPDICKYLGMSIEEVLKMKQSTGLKDAFMDHEFSKSWDELKEKLYKENK